MSAKSDTNIPLKNAKGGRPRKDEDEKRSVRLSTYVTKSEARGIRKKVGFAESSVSDFLRDLALRKEISVSVRPSAVKKLRADIGRTMSNINQIARRVNQGKVDNLANTDLKKMYDELADKLDQLDEL